MKIPFNYLNKQFGNIKPLLRPWKEFAKSTHYTLVPYIEKFEKEFAK